MKTILLSCFLLLQSTAFAQYWQQKVDYTIDVKLNDRDKTLDGFEKIVYQNNSPDTLRFIWFHLWANAYKNDRTAFSDQELINGNTDFYFSGKEQRGYINRLDFRVNNLPAKTENHPRYIDVIKLLLPEPLPTGKTVTITTPFHEKLPFNFSRGGYDGSSFQVTQWYPKPAVYDSKGWHPMPYLDQGEFYSEFGNFNVSITVPPKYIVAATGELKDSAGGTVHYTQTNIHDFAWFANHSFIIDKDTCLLPGGRVITVMTYYTSGEKKTWGHSLQYAKDAVRFYSTEVGEYPFNVVKVVQGPTSFGGGMEYPTITIISPTGSSKQLDITIAHEIGHNWFYGILASNERDHPWMDEGINSFYENKYATLKYGHQPQLEELAFQELAKQGKDQPVETTSEEFSEINYGLSAYHKTSKWMALLEQRLGQQKFREMMHHYFTEWSFKHPQPKDFQELLKNYSSESDSLYSLITQRGLLPNQQLRGFSFITPLKPRTINTFLNHPTKEALITSPILGLNAYDKLMIGGMLTNYKLPHSNFQYIAIPLYATGSKQLNGITRISYSVFPTQGLQKIEWFATASTFSNNEFVDDKGTRFTARFFKVAPGAELTFRQNDPKSTMRTYVQWKSFLIREQPFRISYNTLISGTDTSQEQITTKQKLHYVVHQLKFGLENTRSLYPYSGMVIMQASEKFVKLAFEGHYFFNYRKGGLEVRLFAGKFFYAPNKANYPYGYYPARFFLNMTGSNGEEDYTYSDYFVGRNKFEGVPSQQIAIREGGFKIRTDLLANKIGKTDNWLAALNFNTNVPDNLNPLSVLPVKIPLHLFLDVGTNAEAWQPNAATDHFLYDAGIHLPLFNKIINFYFPLFYSSVFKGYVKSMYPTNKLFKTMSFSIDLDNATKFFRKQLLF